MIIRTENGFENVRLPEGDQVRYVCVGFGKFENPTYFQPKDRQTINKLYFKAVLDSQKKGTKIYRVPFIIFPCRHITFPLSKHWPQWFICYTWWTCTDTSVAPKLIVYVRVHSWSAHSMCLSKCMHHGGTVGRSFTVLTLLCALLIHPPLFPKPWNLLLFYFLHSFVFSSMSYC